MNIRYPSVAALILLLIRKDRLHVNHGLSWIVVAIGFALLGLFPTIIDTVAYKLGIAYPPVLALTVGIAVLVVKTLVMDIERSKLETRNQRMVQRLAMLETELKQLQREQDRD